MAGIFCVLLCILVVEHMRNTEGMLLLEGRTNSGEVQAAFLKFQGVCHFSDVNESLGANVSMKVNLGGNTFLKA